MDVITLTQEMRDRNLLDEVGNPSFITHLFTFTPTEANASYYVDIVLEKAWLRDIHLTAQAVADEARLDHGDPTVLSERLQQLLTALAPRDGPGRDHRCADRHQGTITEQDFQAITRVARALRSAPIFVFDEADSSVLQFRANARRAAREFGCKLIVLDYLQLVGGSGGEDRREQEVAAVSRNMKLAAKELGIPIIVLSQLNKDGATRESRAIQQDLDKLIVIEHEDPDAEGDGKAWIKVKLQRGGAKGSVPVMWRPAITRFDPLATEQD